MEGGRVIGVDIGGTKIFAAVVDGTGRVENLVDRQTPERSQEALLETVGEMIESLRGDDVIGAGIGVPARISRDGRILSAVNTPLADLDPAVLERRYGLPVRAVNDASAAALAEHRFGAGRGRGDLVLLTLGTGVGAGFVLGGALYEGWGEAGHMVIVEGGEPCRGACSGRGHVEAYCSGPVADGLAREAYGPSATARDLVEREHPALNAIGRHLGTAIASLVNLFAPEIVIIGGGFGTSAAHLLLPAVREVLRDEALAPAGEATRLEVAELGGLAGVVGAGTFALTRIARAGAP